VFGGAGKLFPGSMKFKDVNDDGKIDADDRVRSDKTTTPTFQGGLNIGVQYKSFDLSILFQNATGGEVFFKQSQVPLVITRNIVTTIAGPLTIQVLSIPVLLIETTSIFLTAILITC
jgi:hypothetical protein